MRNIKRKDSDSKQGEADSRTEEKKRPTKRLTSAMVLVSALAVNAISSNCTELPPEEETREDSDVDRDQETDRLDADIRFDSDVESYPDGDADLDGDADMDSDVDGDIDAGAGLDADINRDADMDSDVDGDIDAGAGLDADINRDADMDSDVDRDVGGDADLDSDVDTDMDAGLDADEDYPLDADYESDADLYDADEFPPDCSAYAEVDAMVLIPLNPGDESSFHPVEIPGTDVEVDIDEVSSSFLSITYYVDANPVAQFVDLFKLGPYVTNTTTDGCEVDISTMYFTIIPDYVEIGVQFAL